MLPAMHSPALSVALSGIAAELGGGAESLRRAARPVREAGCRAITLDSTLSGLRPRELDRSARRDLAAMLRRTDLASGGVDAFVPVGHLSDPAFADRALWALIEAIAMAGELAQLAPGPGAATVHLALPDRPAADLLTELCAHAERCGVRLADYTPRPDGPPMAGSVIGVGIDPAAMLLGGGAGPARDPALAVARAGTALAGARFSDADAGVRVAPGRGRLEIIPYKAALGVVGFVGPVVLDVRRCDRPLSAMAEGAQRW